jgi:hypothetical protein
MHAERSHDRNHRDDLSALQPQGGSVALVGTGPSKLSNSIVSDPIFQDGIYRFSVTSQRRYA